MKRALVAEAEPDLREFVADTLRTHGWVVEIATEQPIHVSNDVDAVVADLGTAVRNHWIGEHADRPPGAKLVITSAVGSFLEDVRGEVHAVVRTPTTREAFVEAVEHGAHELEAERDVLARPSRQEALEQCGLYGARSDPELTAVAGLAARAVGAKIGLVTLIDSHRQTFLGQYGLPVDLSGAGETPRKWSFCQYVVQSSAPLIVENAREHPSLSGTPLVSLGLVSSYAGVPVVHAGVGVVGTVCVLDEKPRSFDATHLASLELAAGLAASRFEAIARERPPAYAVRATAPAVFQVGDVIDNKFVITARLGEGGQANVYLARDRFVGQLVAIKIQRAGSDPSIVHEGKALARLRHRSIVQLYGWGCLPDGTVYLVLEFVEGETLHRHIGALRRRGEAMPIDEVVDITRSIAGALATLHASSRLHGDVKPANVILDAMMHRPVLIDFGLGVALDGRTLAAGGTPGWSAPEQLDALNPPIASTALDAYGLACLGYVMLTGRGAFEGTRETALTRQRTGDFRPVREARAELASAVDEVFRRAFHEDPEQRFDTPLAFADALAAACSARPSFPPPPGVRAEATPHSHGIVFTSTRHSVKTLIGPEAESELFDSLSPESRRVFERATDPHESYPTSAFIEYVQRYAGDDRARLDALGVLTASLIGGHALRQLRVSHTPETLLHVASELLHHYHDWGSTQVRRTGSHAATLELVAPSEVLPVFCNLFGTVLHALLLATGRHANVEQTRCAYCDGCAACSFDVRWTELGLA